MGACSTNPCGTRPAYAAKRSPDFMGAPLRKACRFSSAAWSCQCAWAPRPSSAQVGLTTERRLRQRHAGETADHPPRVTGIILADATCGGYSESARSTERGVHLGSAVQRVTGLLLSARSLPRAKKSGRNETTPRLGRLAKSVLPQWQPTPSAPTKARVPRPSVESRAELR